MTAIDWGGDSATDHRFLSIVKQWIDEDGEVYVMLWFLKAGGAKNHYLVTSFDQFKNMLTWFASKESSCSVDVYRTPQFPIRGVVTHKFIEEALDKLRDGDEWFLMIHEESPEWVERGDKGWGNSRELLEEELKECLGQYVVLGSDVHWPVPPDAYPGEWISGNLDSDQVSL